jgi:hypothetical protein
MSSGCSPRALPPSPGVGALLLRVVHARRRGRGVRLGWRRHLRRAPPARHGYRGHAVPPLTSSRSTARTSAACRWTSDLLSFQCPQCSLGLVLIVLGDAQVIGAKERVSGILGDLRTVDRHPLASVGTLVLGLPCSWCPGSARCRSCWDYTRCCQPLIEASLYKGRSGRGRNRQPSA